MHVSTGSNDWFLHVSASVWLATRRVRGQLNHGVRRCPQRLDPLSNNDEGIDCQLCSDLHIQTLMVGRKKLKGAAAERLDDALRARSYRLAPLWTLDARDQLAGELGMTVRPNRLPKAKWFRTAVPDPATQELVIDAVYFVRSGDDNGAAVMPFERFAPRVGLTVDDARRRLLHAIEALREAKPQWVTDNIDRPLSRRFDANLIDGSDGLSDNTGYGDLDKDDEDGWGRADEA